MSATAITAAPARSGHAAYILAWAFCLLFYFGQYALRSAPGVDGPARLGHRLPLLGYIADRIGRRKPVLIGGALLMLAATAVLVYLPNMMPSYLMGRSWGLGRVPQ